ncbi:MAG TPA: hypothetical protein VFW07_23980 [Parafilimonas sp.]|nr:hypothetical protein [Parafilimonas sp.]
MKTGFLSSPLLTHLPVYTQALWPLFKAQWWWQNSNRWFTKHNTTGKGIFKGLLLKPAN